MQYVPELTWMLFVRILDEQEEKEAEQAKAVVVQFRPSLEYPYRWRDWAAPPGAGLPTVGSQIGRKRKELQESTLGAFMSFVNGELIPHLRNLKSKPGTTSRQKVISEVFSSIERTGVDTERNLLDILDKVHELSLKRVDETHMFPISQVHEGLLQKIGEKNNDGGQFFTPREMIRTMVTVINPEVGETVYDPCCGTGVFLAQAYQHMKEKARTAVEDNRTPDELIPIIKAHAAEIARAIEALKSKDLTARDPGVPSVTRAIRTNDRHRSPRQADP